jgi:hypothetical protein
MLHTYRDWYWALAIDNYYGVLLFKKTYFRFRLCLAKRMGYYIINRKYAVTFSGAFPLLDYFLFAAMRREKEMAKVMEMEREMEMVRKMEMAKVMEMERGETKIASEDGDR